MPATITVTLNVKPGKRDDLLQLLKGALPDTRSFDGCYSVNVLSDQSNPNKVLFYAAWESKAHYDKYLAWRTQQGMLVKLKEYLTGDPVWGYWNLVSV